MHRSIFLGALVTCLLACAAETGGEDAEASVDAITATAQTHVSRRADGALVVDTPIAAACSAGCVDADHDGLADAWEDAVLARLVPTVTFDEDEPLMNHGEDRFAAAGRVWRTPDGKVLVNVALLYTRDYGAPNPLCFHGGSHPGDVEHVALELDVTGKRAVVTRTFTTGHEGTEDDQSRVWTDLKSIETVPDPATKEPRWRVYSSQAKHATYATKKQCESARLATFLHRFCVNEDCAPDDVDHAERFSKVPRVVNVGEPAAHRTDDLTGLGFPGEDAWGTKKFCGGLPIEGDARTACPPPVAAKLGKSPFGG